MQSPPGFDPYHKWLGIRPQEQPPTLYRLLGVADFESDPDVISHAADQRMAHIRSLQTGQHAPLSQKLLNEISNARLCLLNPEKKSAYDAELMRRQESAISAAAPAAAPVVAIDPADARNSKGGSLPFALVSVAVVVLVLGGIAGAAVLFLLPRSTEPPVATGPNASPANSNAADSTAPPEDPSTDAVDQTLNELPATAPAPAENPATAPPEPAPTTPMEQPPMERPAETPPKETPPVVPAPDTPTQVAPPPVEPAPARPAAAPKLTVPADEELVTAKERVREIFQSDYLAAKDDAEKMRALSATILREEKSPDLQPPARFALLQVGADMAALGGDVVGSWQAYASIEARFDFDAGPLQRAMVEGVVKLPRPASQNKEVAGQLLELVDTAMADDDLDSAALLSASAVALARKASDTDLLKRAVARNKEIEEQATRYNKEVKPALAVLETNPDDPAANLAVGKYLALVKKDWKQAVPLLAKATDDGEYHPAAKQELAGDRPVDAANQWYDLAQKENDAAAKNSLLMHAKDLYQAGLSKLSGLEKTRAERRLAELAAIEIAKPAPAAAETEPSGPSVVAAPKAGKRTPVKVVASGCNYVHVRVNGIELFPKHAGRETASSALAALREGDLIALEIDGRIDTMSAWLVFVDAEGEFLFETSPDWWMYRPPDKNAWWNIVGQKLEDVKPAEYCDLKTQYVDRVQRAISTALPDIPLTPPICSTLGGPDKYDPVYLYYVVKKDDLIPKKDHKRPTDAP